MGNDPPLGEKHKLLALDGGGLRGAFTLGVLGEMERLLRQSRAAGDEFRLADYFDFIGGTSTGAIIASGLSLGWSVQELVDKYVALGDVVFRPRRFLPLRFWSKYPGGPLADQLRKSFGDREFGDEDLRTLLMIVMHNRTTDSPWPITNAPFAVYNDDAKPTHRNRHAKLWQLVSASTAAPAFFPAVRLDFGAGDREFVDGGVTAHNNPSLALFLAATLPQYKVCWQTGSDRLLLISIGTGSRPGVLNNTSRVRRHLLYVATKTPAGLMFAAANNNDIVCRAIADARFGPHLDSELSDMVGCGLTEAKLFSYARYNIELEDNEIAKYDITDVPARELAKLDAKKHVPTMIELGDRYAKRWMKPEHFAGFP